MQSPNDSGLLGSQQSAFVIPPIRPLDRDVIGKIAAGEILTRPVNCVKEMLENCIDAKATAVQVVVKEGGLKFISITDNGSGIRKEDMAIVCERFTTSKLCSFEDLESISTYGFRGEALASISHTSHVTITTMTHGSMHAYKASYKNGIMIGENGQPSSEPKPCAGTPGTQIIVDDLFYNYPIRKSSMNASEEYSKIYDMMLRYALHNAGIAISLKKHGENKSDINTKKTSTVKDNIREFFGLSLSKDIIRIELDTSNESSYENLIENDDSTVIGNIIPQFTLNGWVSGPSWSSKRSVFILFINDRLVSCAPLKKTLEAHFATMMSKAARSWIYLSLKVDPKKVDVNMHPNKREVGLENQSAIIHIIGKYFIKCLDQVNEQRFFKSNDSSGGDGQESFLFQKTPSSGVLPAAYSSTSTLAPYKIRTQGTDGSIDSFINPAHTTVVTINHPNDKQSATISSSIHPTRSIDLDSELLPSLKDPSSKKRPREDSTQSARSLTSITQTHKTIAARAPNKPRDRITHHLTTIKELLDECSTNQNEDLQQVLKSCSFVGCISARRCLIQHSKVLYLLDVHTLSKHLLYQECLHSFKEFRSFKLSHPAPIFDLAMMALSSIDSHWEPIDGDLRIIAQAIANRWIERAELLWSYFGIRVSPNGEFINLPEIIDGYMPPLDGLAFFVMRFYTEVEWREEKDTLDKIAREIAELYCTPVEEYQEEAENSLIVSDTLSWNIEHKIFPAMRARFMPPKSLPRETIHQVASTEKLYKIFERC